MFGPTSPAYSIGTSKREQAQEKAVPGPASYNISRDPIPRSVSFNRAKRNSRSQSNVPGPGSYAIGSFLGKAPHAIILSRKPLKPNLILPGPADYVPKDFSQTIKYTFRSRSNTKIFESNPGPGQYNGNLMLFKKKSPSAVFGTSKKESYTPRSGPGPADYGIDRKLRGPRFSFSREKRDTQKLELGPGPGQYEIPHTIGTARSSQSLNNTILA